MNGSVITGWGVLNPWHIASILLSAATGSYLLLPWASAPEITAHTLFPSKGVTELVNGVTKSLHMQYQWMWRGVKHQGGGGENGNGKLKSQEKVRWVCEGTKYSRDNFKARPQPKNYHVSLVECQRAV